MTIQAVTVVERAEVRIGDVYAPAGKPTARYAVFAFSDDGEHAHVNRSTSKRKQAILCRRLANGEDYKLITRGPR